MDYKQGILNKGDSHIFVVGSNNLVPLPDYIPDSHFLCVRGSGNFDHKGIWLSKRFDWQIVRDDQGELVLLSLEKDCE